MNLATSYLGLKLKNPVIHAASPLSKDLGKVKQLEDAGASAIVMYSLFEEQIDYEKRELDHFLTMGTDSFAEALNYFPEPEEYHNIDAEEYLNHIRELKQSVEIPIIASLNGVSKGGWMRYAKFMEEAGADAIELNVYYVPTDSSLTSDKVEQIYLDALKSVKESVGIPVALKVGPFFTAFASFAQRVDQAGADGLVLFNRFFGPEIDLNELEVVPRLTLSTQMEMQLPLRWIAVLYGQLKADLAATSGIHTAADVIKMIMAGANAAMLVSSLYEKGINHVSKILSDMTQWMEEHEYESVEQMRGSMSYQKVAEPAAYERANYMKTLQSFSDV
jgi:dihydroorotate dehydrogenase (fumarate)